MEVKESFNNNVPESSRVPPNSKADVPYVCRLLAAKARIHRIQNTPRSEMNGLLMLSRLLTVLLPWLVDKPSQITFIGDSQCTIASCETERSVMT